MFDMFKVITKNFFSKPVTRLYPLNTERKPFERSRGRIIFNPENCMLCSLCARRCPADAITVDRKTGKWELNVFRCIICGECVKSCPKKCITMSSQRRHSASKLQLETFHKEIPKPVPRPAVKPAAAKLQTATKQAASIQPAAKPIAGTQAAAKPIAGTQAAAKPIAGTQAAAKTQSAPEPFEESTAYKESAAAKQ